MEIPEELNQLYSEIAAEFKSSVLEGKPSPEYIYVLEPNLDLFKKRISERLSEIENKKEKTIFWRVLEVNRFNDFGKALVKYRMRANVA